MKTRVGISIEVELLERADARAAQLGQSRTTFVERALAAHLRANPALPESGGSRPTSSAPLTERERLERRTAAMRRATQ